MSPMCCSQVGSTVILMSSADHPAYGSMLPPLSLHPSVLVRDKVLYLLFTVASNGESGSDDWQTIKTRRCWPCGSSLAWSDFH